MATAGDTKGLIRELKAQGWEVLQTSRGHYRAKPPGGASMVHFSDSADPRAWHNNMSQLAKSGFTNNAQSKEVGLPVALLDVGSVSTCPVCGSPFDDRAGECLGTCAAVEPVEQDLEQYWAKLKEAKELLLLAEDEAGSAGKAAQEAAERQQEAQLQVKRCQQVLVNAKKKFDQMFGGVK